jgi:hypothetical protein
VRRVDGSAVVVEVRADERIEPKDVEAFEVTRIACAQAAWHFERVGMPEPVLLANVRWLSRYRHPRCLHLKAADRLREVFATPGPLLPGADAAGDRLATPPALFHLLLASGTGCRGPIGPVAGSAHGRGQVERGGH